MNRLSIVFRQGRLAGLAVDPFTIDAARHLLGNVAPVVTPIAATPWQAIPDLYARLAAKPTAAHLCLQLVILTAVRGDPARGARLDEMEAGVWTVPADRIKGRQGKVEAFRVPLSDEAQALVARCRPGTIDGLLFPARKHSGDYGLISVSGIETALDVLGEAGRPHGFRTSFRTWVQDKQAAPYDVAETVLGHIMGSKVERSYA